VPHGESYMLFEHPYDTKIVRRRSLSSSYAGFMRAE